MKKLIIILLIPFIFLTGCQKEETKEDTTGEMSYESTTGKVEYKKNPKIYADYYIGQLLYLNADVVGADMTYPAKTWIDVAKERRVENISENPEKVAALKPDLIITINQDKLDQYEAIAPTIYISYDDYNPEEIMVELGKILGKEKEANDWVKEFNNSVDKLKIKIDKKINKDNTIGIVDAWGDGIYMYGANYGRGGYLIYNKLGLKGTEDAEKDYIRKKGSHLTIDAEGLPKYAGDITIIMSNAKDTITKLPTYKSLNSVKNNKVLVLDYNTFWYDDVYSLNEQIKVLNEVIDEL